MQKLLMSKHLLLLATSAITSSLVIAKPSLASTLATSNAGFRLDNFSVNPRDVKTFTNTNTQAVSFNSQGKVSADANANANFNTFLNPSQSVANNLSLATTSGQGKDYFGIAESFASVTGFSFQIAPEDTFSFDFMGFLNLQASVENPATEYAGADSLISLQLYDQDSGILLDSLTIEGSITTPSNINLFTNNKTENFSFNPSETFFNTEANSIKKDVNASIKGNYSRKFSAGANISLFELKSNRAKVVVPEPTSCIALIFGAASIFLIAKVKRRVRCHTL
jgi:hypothetical protein